MKMSLIGVDFLLKTYIFGEINICWEGRIQKMATPWTLSESHGTKIFGAIFFSTHESKMLFYEIFDLYGKK